VSLDSDVDTNKELIAHGYSNFFAGLFGTVPNYLVYVNTLLYVVLYYFVNYLLNVAAKRFYRVGGTTRLSGFMLAGATLAVLLAGTGPIAYIRESIASPIAIEDMAMTTWVTAVMVVAALIFVLGIDLVKEALWDTRQRVSKPEYITIASIMVAMTVWDFVIGVLFGIIVSCKELGMFLGLDSCTHRFYTAQAFSLSYKTHSGVAFALCTQEKRHCRQCADPVPIVRTSGRFRGRRPSCTFRGSFSSALSRALRRPSALLSPSPNGCARQFAS